MRSNPKRREQPKFDVIDCLRKVSAGRRLRERLLNLIRIVFEWLAYFKEVTKAATRSLPTFASRCFMSSVNAHSPFFKKFFLSSRCDVANIAAEQLYFFNIAFQWQIKHTVLEQGCAAKQNNRKKALSHLKHAVLHCCALE